MVQYLEGYQWNPIECKRMYFDAVGNKDPKAFRHFWDAHVDWQEEIRKVICRCIRVLWETGVKGDSKSLSVLWIPARGHRYLVRIRDPEPDWVEFLRDTTDYFTMAVGLGKCLDFDHGMGRRCRCKGSCVFETALVVNRKIKPQEFRRRHSEDPGSRDVFWDVSTLEQGDRFPLGHRGELEVTEKLDRESVLVEWQKVARVRRMRDILDEIVLGREPESHWEYIENDEELDSRNEGPGHTHRNRKPLNVCIISS
jgi:hypothetical protein